MDMNRPTIEFETRPESSRGSSGKSGANRSAIDDSAAAPGRLGSAAREFKEEDEHLIGEENAETKLYEENQALDPIEQANIDADENKDVLNESEIPKVDDGSLIDDNLDKTMLEPNDSSIILDKNQSLNTNDEIDSTLDVTQPDAETQIGAEHAELDKLDLDKSNDGVELGKEKEKSENVYQKKDIKRKVRQPNRFADGNLIPEEDDNQDSERIRSPPGPPPLEPISQILDHDQFDKSNLTHLRHDGELTAGTPDKMDITLDEDYQEVEVEVKPTREELMARYHSIVEERDRLQNINNQLHHKLADYFRKKKSEDTQNQPMFDKSSQEHEQKYSKYLAQVELLKKEAEKARIEDEKKTDELKQRCDQKLEMVEEERMKLIKLKRDTGVASVLAQNGKHLDRKEVEALLERERQKEHEVTNIRIEFIKLTNQLKKRDDELKQRQNTGETKLEMIDFEQLKIENQTYNEKIEERNEELLKLRKKINNTVQTLSHVKEKLQYYLAQNDKQKQNLSVYDEQVKKTRDVLNKMKQSRDSLRLDNGRLKQKSGLLGNNVLLKDLEDCVDKTESLEMQIEQLKRRYAELSLDSKGFKQKVNQVKQDKIA